MNRAAFSRPFVAAAIVTVVTIVGSACRGPIAPYSRLSALRVLAIKSEPAAPAPGEKTTLSALVYAPKGEAISYSWSWCPAPGSANDGYPCLADEHHVADLFSTVGVDSPRPISFPLGTGETAALQVDIPAEALRALCERMTVLPNLRPDAGADPAEGNQAPAASFDAGSDQTEDSGAEPDLLADAESPDAEPPSSDGGADASDAGADASDAGADASDTGSDASDASDGGVDASTDALAVEARPDGARADGGLTIPGDCEGGFPVLIKLRVATATQQVIAVRTVRIRLDERDRNLNPVLDGLVVKVATNPAAVDPTSSPIVPRNQSITVVARVAESAAERFRRLDERQVLVDRREGLLFSWFVEGGQTNPERVSFIENVVPFERAIESTWDTPSTSDYVASMSQVFVVVRDSRGGVAWRNGFARLGADR